MKPHVVVLGAPGTNRHKDLLFAFHLAGADGTFVDILQLDEHMSLLRTAQIIAIAGGFSYADALGSGRVFAHELSHQLGDILNERIARGVPTLGICNGFQVLVRMGILPGIKSVNSNTDGALQHNKRGTFECRWVTLAPAARHCVWTALLDEVITCPVAHGEGRFILNDSHLKTLVDEDRIAFRYVTRLGAAANGEYPANPNGSMADIAGICDASGVVLGMMPHPENHVTTRQGLSGSSQWPSGIAINLFRNGVQHVINA